MSTFPRFLRIRQDFPRTPALDYRATLEQQFEPLRSRITRGARIAVGVGSRGITDLAKIVSTVVDSIVSAGAKPFVIPAMGSHGGATPEGQRELLAGYGVTEQALGISIRDSLEVRQVGVSRDAAPVYCSVEALSAEGIIVINRVKPHTDFTGALGSGLLKMCVIGLGKRRGAAAMHLAASQVGHERAIRGMADVLLQRTPILGGVAILENQYHAVARLAVLTRDEMVAGEEKLLVEARALMPSLPFEEIDLLIVDRLGKNISGTGMDTNIIHRSVNGYSSTLIRDGRPAPFIRRIFVRDLTPETHGNAIGIGMADLTTTRLVRGTDLRVTNINALTSLTPQSAKLPMAFDTDREAIERALGSLPLVSWADARIVRIADTLSLGEIEVSEPLWPEVADRTGIVRLTAPESWHFASDDNLA